MAGGEPRLGTTATYMRRDNQRSAIPCQSEIAMLHDRNHGKYQAFSAASLKTWSKFGLVVPKRCEHRCYRRKTWGGKRCRLEIGVDSGQNVPLYASAIDYVCAIDPSAELPGLARNRIADVLGAPGVSGFSKEVWNDSRARP